MLDPDLERIHDLFDRAVDLSPETRAPFLERECNGDTSLRREVEALIAAEEQAGQFLKEPSFNPNSAAAVVVGAETVGSVIGPYKLVQHLGDGGGGSVFLAEQDRPVKRRVALKVIRLGMDTREVIARFAAERQALAIMDHPGIAKVYDAGATSTGRPFFAIELVDGGVAITKFCDQQKLGLRDRLRLFVHVCHAVQHAHHKGIIHRDLKPSNILVTMLDGKPYPTVIDFGIAKATTQRRIGDETVRTEQTAFVGTPLYMSPEQATIGGGDVDTRSDIYSMGVLLYELLTGTTPFDPKSLHNATFADVQKMIREIDPPRPSTRVGSRRDTLMQIATERATAPSTLRAHLRGELDWIVMKCLEKQRDRRYDSAGALAADIEAFLDGRAIQAAPPSNVYLARKFIARHSILIGTAASILIAVTAGLIIAVVALQRLRVEQQKTLTALAEAERQRREAQTATEIAGEVNKFLNDMLSKADPRETRGKELTVSSMLDKAAKEIAGRFPDRPLVEAAIRETIGRSYSALYKDAASIEQLSRALELRAQSAVTDDPQSLDSRGKLASSLHNIGRFAEAAKEYKQVFADAQRVLNSPGDDTVVALDALVDSQVPLEIPPGELLKLLQLAVERRARVLGDQATPTVIAREAFAWQTARSGDHSNAEVLLRKSVTEMAAAKDIDGWRIARTRIRLGMVLVAMNRDEEGFALCKQGLAEMDAYYGVDHPYTIPPLRAVAQLCEDATRWQEALPLFQELLRRAKIIYGDQSAKTVAVYQLIAGVETKLGRFEDGEKTWRLAVRASQEVLGPDDMVSIFAQNSLGKHLVRYRSAAEAESVLTEVVARLSGKVRDDSAMILEPRTFLARAQYAAGHREQALATAKDVYEKCIANTRPSDAKPMALLTSVYGPMLAIEKQFAAAEPVLRESLSRLEATGQAETTQARAVLQGLQDCATAAGRKDEAEALKQRVANLQSVTSMSLRRSIQLYE